jgi:hypothetical protein
MIVLNLAVKFGKWVGPGHLCEPEMTQPRMTANVGGMVSWGLDTDNLSK